jgi:hypothetical protein
MKRIILTKNQDFELSSNPPSGYKFIGYDGESLSEKDDNGDIVPISESLQTTGTDINFTSCKIYNTSVSPGTASITGDYNDAKLGVMQKIYHQDSNAPTVPGTWILLGSNSYDITKLNIIYSEWCGGNRVEYWIENINV